MSNSLNKFLTALEAALVAGFTRNGRQFFGTGSGEVLSVIDYRGVEKPLKILTSFPSKDLILKGRTIAIHQFTPDDLPLVGGSKKQYDIRIDVFLSDAVSKIVDGDKLKEDQLARYLMDEFNDGMPHLKAEMESVSKVVKLAGIQQTGRVGESNLSGFSLKFSVTLN